MPPKNSKVKQEKRNDISRLDSVIKSGEFPPVILLTGESGYLLGFYKDKLLSLLGDPKDTMNFTRYDGTGTDPREIVEMAGTLPCFRDDRLILVEGSGFFRSKSKDPGDEEEQSKQDPADPDALTGYLKDPCTNTHLIFVEESVDSRKKNTKAIDAMGGYFVIGELDDGKFQKWVSSVFKRYGKSITGAVYEHLIDRCGRDMDVLAGEIRKLSDYLGDETVVSMEAVDAVCIRSFENRVFEMIDDMMAGRVEAALGKYHDLLMLNESEQKTRILIMRQYVRLAMVKEAQVKGQDVSGLTAAFKIAPFAMKKLEEKAGKCSYQLIKKAAEECVDIESACRSRSLGDGVGTEYLVLTLSSKYRITG